MRRLTKKSNILLKILCILAVLSFVASSGFVIYARYIYKDESINSVRAKEFYFTSDFLDGEEHKIPANGTITINLMNHADELRFSEVDIPYKLEVTSSNDGDCDNISIKKGNTVVNSTEITGTIVKGKEDDGTTHDHILTISGMKVGKTYTIKAKTTGTYDKELTGTIKVNEIDTDLHASVEDHDEYIELIVWKKYQESNPDTFSLTYPSTLIPDNTNNLMTNWMVSNDNTTKSGLIINNHESLIYRFFKKESSKKYNVKVNGNEVIISVDTTS